MERFSLEKIADSLYRIHCPGYVFAYLAVGKKEAVLIDAGYGLGSIKEAVRSVTDLPLKLVLTHGHFDHCGGVAEFDEVYIADEDCWVYERDVDTDKRATYICDNYGFPRSELLEANKEVTLVSLKPGSEMDLGGLTLKFIPLKGHTLGSMCILFKELRTILAGDALNSYCMLMFDESSTVLEYYNSLLELKAYEDLYDEVLYSHPGNRGGKEILDEMIDICQEIFEGTDDRIETKVAEREGCFYLAKKRNEAGRRIDNKWANLLYENIR